ncbi:MAG: alpha/beta fold hydrolase [Deltaproteobacteria bacterium]|nr:alpha/beta fold hydrolase [Deltaproteobacteria bacterium]
MGFIIGLILITIFLFFPLVTYILFWYETANSAYGDELAEISGGRTFGWILKGILSSVLSSIISIGCYPLGLIRTLWRPGPRPSASTSPVILIHGLYHNASAWICYRWWLKRAGYDRVYAFNYNSLTRDFQEISGQLDQWIMEISHSFPGDEIIMVGHSLGGLLAKAYAGRKEASRGPAVKAIVTLGSPYGGSKLVVLGIGRLARSLAYEGPLIRELNNIHIPSGVVCTALRSPVDNMVLPAGSLKPPSGWRDEWTGPICHVAMLYHGPTFKRVLNLMEPVARSAET